MIPAKAQSNPGSTNGTDAEMELTWPDGQTYSTSLQNLWNYIALPLPPVGFNLHRDYAWSESGGGSGTAIDKVNSPYWSAADDDLTWPGGRWPELGVGVDTYIPTGGTNVAYAPQAGYDRFYFGSQSFQSSDGMVTIQNQDQPEFVMLTGGAPGATGNELYSISGSAYTMFYTDKSLPDSTGTVVPPNQIQIGNLVSLDTNGVLYASLPVHSSVPVTPHVNSSGYHIGHFYPTAYKLVSQCVATTPGNRARTTIGVGEQVNLYFNPSPSIDYRNFAWSTTAGSLTSTQGNSTQLTAPSSAGSATVTATVRGQPVSITFNVVAPSSYDHAQLTATNHYPVGVAGAGMTNLIWISPTNVSFYRVNIMEVGEDATNISGYFSQWTPQQLHHNTADHWTSLNQANQFVDYAGSYSNPPPWSVGGYAWDIPARWQVVGSGATNSMKGWNQAASIVTLGTVTVQKFQHSVTRTVNDLITAQ
jgi:hypothetical protein